MTTLNPHQSKAAHDPAPTVVVRAGAGTGKTRCLIARAAYERQRDPAARVVLLAFTRAAAGEMQRRLDAAGIEGAVATTCHGLALRIIQRHGAGPVSVIDQHEADQLLREGRQRYRGGERHAAAVCQRDHLVRYSDLLPDACVLLDCPDVVATECGAVLLVDEAQDLTVAEWSLIRALRPSRLTVVGDEAQAIYGWRGGLANILYWAGGRRPAGADLVVHTLPINYRSTQAILDAANGLRIPDAVALRGVRGPGETPPAVVQFEDDHQCAEYVARMVTCAEYGPWAILSRTKGRLTTVARVLDAAGIAYRAPCLEAGVWETPEARELIDVMHVVANPHDSLHLARILLRSGWTGAQLARAEASRALDACSLWDWACAHPGPDVRVALELAQMEKARISHWTGRDCLDWPGCSPWLGPETPPGLTPAELLGWLASPGAREEAAADDAGGVYLGTIHSAKGREWPNVVVIGCEEGHLPLDRRGIDLDEERRLLYVAQTRAADRLVLTWSSEWSSGWGRMRAGECSRFLARVVS